MFSQNLNFLRMVLIGLIISLTAINVSCSAPKTKGAYLDEFETFMVEVEENHYDFTNRQWEEYDEKYEKFTGEWQLKFQEEFTVYDELKVRRYILQYNYYKQKISLFELFEISKEDIETLKTEIQSKVEFYIENDMEDDLDLLIKEAKEISDTLVVFINESVEEYNQNK